MAEKEENKRYTELSYDLIRHAYVTMIIIYL